MSLVPAMFEGLTQADILALKPEDCQRGLTFAEIEMIFKACGAFWYHPGEKNPKAPHVLLVSGNHSNIYVNCPLVLQRTNLCQILAQQVVYLLQSKYSGPIDWVIGSDSSALGLSKDVANLLGASWHPMQKGPNKTQIWEKAVIPCGDWVLQVEELLTTSLTTQMVRDGIMAGNPNQVNFVPFIPVLVHHPIRGTSTFINGSALIWLLHYDTFAIDPEKEECPLCSAGSVALPAKENWGNLVSSM